VGVREGVRVCVMGSEWWYACVCVSE
jgi:hypothetical protein